MEHSNYIFLTIKRNCKRKFYLDEILYIEANNTYSTVKLRDGECCVISRPIKDFESMLNSPNFYRISRSVIVNLHYVIEIETGSNPILKLTNDKILVPDKNKVKEIEQKLQSSQADIGLSQSEQMGFTK